MCKFWFFWDFLPHVADYPGVQRITFLFLKPAKRGQNVETVFTDLLIIFALGKSEICKFTIFVLLSVSQFRIFRVLLRLMLCLSCFPRLRFSKFHFFILTRVGMKVFFGASQISFFTAAFLHRSFRPFIQTDIHSFHFALLQFVLTNFGSCFGPTCPIS